MAWEMVGGLASALGGYLSSREQRKAAEQASRAQLEATNAGLDFQRQQFGQARDFQQGLLGQALGFERGLFDEGRGFQQQQFDRSLGLQRGLFDQALGYQDRTLGELTGLQDRTLDEVRGILSPYIGAGQQALSGIGTYANAGLPALQGQQALAGLLGPDAQRQAIEGIASGPELAALVQQGENAILQNASATGGLRGGNTQAALAQFRPQVLSQLINQRYAQLGGLAGLGAQNFDLLGRIGQAGVSQQTAAAQNALAARTGLASQFAGNVANLTGNLGSNLTSLSGQTAGNVANLANSLGGNFANISNQLANNVAQLGGAFGTSVGNLLGQRGDAISGNALAQGQANAGLFQLLGGLPNQAALLQALRARGGIPNGSLPSSDASSIDFLKGFGLGGR